MDTAKIYSDSDGNECSIIQMVKREPEWAANRIQEGEKAIERVKELEDENDGLSAATESLGQDVYELTSK